MMTKSRDFYVRGIELTYLQSWDGNIDIKLCSDRIDQPVPPHKITITYEVPEKTVTITKSQFDDACNTEGRYGLDGYLESVKSRLFGDKNVLF